jgi:hypothetical protein
MDTENAVLLGDADPPPREQYGFRRTTCGCVFCQAPCRHLPGSLDVSDLERMCPPGQDLFAWAELHLRALPEKPFLTLVPARQANGHCHWFVEGRCTVHQVSPYGCAFYDLHMSDEEAAKRTAATVQARNEDEAKKGLYYQVWRHLCQKGLTGPRGDREGLAADLTRIRRNVERNRRRQQSS